MSQQGQLCLPGNTRTYSSGNTPTNMLDRMGLAFARGDVYFILQWIGI